MTGNWDLGALRVLVTVGATESISEAARDLGVSQQAVSSRLRSMERNLGRKLVRRTPRGSSLSDDGELIAAWAQEVLESIARFDAAVDSLVAADVRPLTVAASLTIAEHLLPRWLVRMRLSAPVDSARRIELTAVNSENVIARVRDGRDQLGLIETPDVPKDLSSTVIARDELLVVVAPAHPWAARSTGITARELAGTALVLRERGSGTRRTLERALAEHQGSLTLAEPELELPTTASVRSTVIAGHSPTVLSSLAVGDALAAGTLVRVKVNDLRLRRPLTAIWLPPRRSLDAAARRLLEIATREN